MKNVADKSCGENQNTHFVFSNTFFFFKLCLLWDNVETYNRVRQATDDNMVHAHHMLDTQGYKHTLIICNTYCFSHSNEHATVLWLLTLPVLISVRKFVSASIGYRKKWVAPGPTLSCWNLFFSQCCFIIILCVALVVTIKVYCPLSAFKCWRYGIQDHSIFKNSEHYMISDHDWLRLGSGPHGPDAPRSMRSIHIFTCFVLMSSH